MNAAARELAWQNARILAMLPIEQWIDELLGSASHVFCRDGTFSLAGKDFEVFKLLRAMLEVKRVVSEVEGMEARK